MLEICVGLTVIVSMPLEALNVRLSVPAAPSMVPDRLAPELTRKRSVPVPPPRFSMPVKEKVPSMLPASSPVRFQVLAALGPATESEASPPMTDSMFERPPVPVAAPVARLTVMGLVYAE